MILGISGRKQAGKNTTANILHGMILKEQGFVNDWSIGANGQLMIDSPDADGWGEFDVTRQDEQFTEWAEHNMWPYVKVYSFADHLKWICIKLFDIPFECCFGTDEQKNQVQEHLLWENMPGVITCSEVWDSLCSDGEPDGLMYHAAGPMTAREFMQYRGTDIMRKMYEPIWLENCFRRIEEDKPEIAIIGDCRFMNEIHAVQERGGKVIRLKRSLYECNHQSEIDADNYEGFDDVIENDSMNLQESCDLFIESLIKLGITKKLREINKFTASIK